MFARSSRTYRLHRHGETGPGLVRPYVNEAGPRPIKAHQTKASPTLPRPYRKASAWRLTAAVTLAIQALLAFTAVDTCLAWPAIASGVAVPAGGVDGADSSDSVRVERQRGGPAAAGSPASLGALAPVIAPTIKGGHAATGVAGEGDDPESDDGDLALAWPLRGQADTSEVVHAFDPPPQPWLAGHRGVDLRAHPAQDVIASADGVVVFAGELGGRGVVSIQHAGGLRTTYEPLEAVVVTGDAVHQGDVIGTLAPSGSHCDSGCLHWGLRAGEDHYLDPMLFLGGKVQIRLYPLATSN